MAVHVDPIGHGRERVSETGERTEERLTEIDSPTIFAPATAVGRAAIGVLRISGSEAARVCRALTKRSPPEARAAALRDIRDPETGELIDRAIVVFFPAPNSFSGEDMLEIQHHGGMAVLDGLLRALSGIRDLRAAEPGEITKRAFFNGKLDLTQAEGIADLIEATTVAQARQALEQMSGGLGARLERWRKELLSALAMLEAEIDFSAEEDVPEDLWDGLSRSIASVRQEIEETLADDGRGERLRAGIVVAVTGSPNVGKSTLVNLLAGRDVAIVTPVPGTTRDVLEVTLDLRGLPVVLLDTAGVRATDDPIEAEGVRRALDRAKSADIELVIVDAPAELPREQPVRGLVVLNKCDEGAVSDDALCVSAHTGFGIETMIERLHDLSRELVPGSSAIPITRARHRQALTDASAALRFCLEGDSRSSLDLLCEDLRIAVAAVGRVTGRVGIEEVLDEIFSSFCIGK